MVGGKMVYTTLGKLAESGIYFSKRAEEKISCAEKAAYDKSKDFNQKKAEAYSALKDLEDFNKKALPVIKKFFDDDEQQNELERGMNRLRLRLKEL